MHMIELTGVNTNRPTTTTIDNADPVHIPLEDNTAALVIIHIPKFANRGRHHQPDITHYYEWVIELIDEAERLLETGGRIALITPNQESQNPYLDLSQFLIKPLLTAGFIPPTTYCWALDAHHPPANIKLSHATAAEMRASPNSWQIIIAAKNQDLRQGSILEREHNYLPHHSNIPEQTIQALTQPVWIIPHTTAGDIQGDLPPHLIEILITALTFENDLIVNPLAGTPTILNKGSELKRIVAAYEPDPTTLATILADQTHP